MTEIDPEQRDVLVQRFLQGESTIQMAAAEGVSQPTISRRVEGALEHLRERLRQKGVGVAAAVLGTMMAATSQEAPAMVMVELGKMALVTSGTAAASTATATVLGLNAKLAVAAAVAVVGVGGYVTYRAMRPAETTPPTVATAPLAAAAPALAGEPAATAVGAQTAPATSRSSVTPAAASAVSSGPAQFGGVAVARGPGGEGGAIPSGGVAIAAAMPMGGVAYGGMVVQTPQTRDTTEGAVTLFARALYAMARGRGSLAQLEECFAGTAEAEAFRRILENPETDAERELQQVLKSLGPVIQVVQTTATEDGLKVKWKAAVQQSFTTTQNGVTKAWRLGEGYELELRLKQVGGEWKIAGF
jgi:hypothetical protein